MGKLSGLPSLNGVETLPEKTFSSLEEAILQGKIKPGDRLIENELSRWFGISRGPIREAFRSMEKEGLIKMVPRKGAVVCSLSPEDLSETYEIISALEGLAGRLFCERGTKEDLARLKKLYQEMETRVKNNNLSKYEKLNRRFHDVFISGSRNKRIKQICSTIQKQILWFQKVTLSYKGRPEISLREHKRMLDAFSKRDSERAEHEVREHINRAARTYLNTIGIRGVK
jgi:DNA-binding GntR family transcriptional regulator